MQTVRERIQSALRFQFKRQRVTDASFDAWQGRTKSGPFRDVSGRGRAYAGRFFRAFSGRRTEADNDALCSGRRGNDGEPHPSALAATSRVMGHPVRLRRPPHDKGHPVRLRRPPHDKPQTGKATRAAARLSAGRGLPTDTENPPYFPRTSLVSLPRLGAWSARKTVRWTVFSGRRAAAPDGGSERQRGDG